MGLLPTGVRVGSELAGERAGNVSRAWIKEGIGCLGEESRLGLGVSLEVAVRFVFRVSLWLHAKEVQRESDGDYETPG